MGSKWEVFKPDLVRASSQTVVNNKVTVTLPFRPGRTLALTDIDVKSDLATATLTVKSGSTTLYTITVGNSRLARSYDSPILGEHETDLTLELTVTDTGSLGACASAFRK